MKNTILKIVIRSRFAITSQASVEKQTRKVLREYLQLAQGMDDERGSTPTRVKRMIGVDEDMRGWSFFEILRHNAIVNQSISATVRRLALKEPAPTRKFDTKKDVMPEQDCGVEQIGLFKSSVLDHLAMVEELGDLKGRETSTHPVFGPLNAHGWNCMFPFHLRLHFKQARSVKNAVLSGM
ncbi:DinB family protein [Luteolibacter sp. AS25]|uniref:DinB family protein n=1 Tax=Luteolibacter sp. AS25 TaxID=3135776 RepID=UPI00398B23DF